MATLYHATTDKNAAKIAKKGIVPLQPSNWVQAGSRERYGGGEIFAFDHPLDAMRWACRMDWELNKKMGSGKIVIVEFADDAQWVIDDADPLSQAGRKGNWLKRFGSVKPEQIVSITPLTQEHVKRVVASNPTTDVLIQAVPQDNGVIWIDLFEVPKGERGKGVGTRAYKQWEKQLPKWVKRVELYAVDASYFWDSLGFKYDDERDGIMVKDITRPSRIASEVKSAKTVYRLTHFGSCFSHCL
jgi:hypothetical protein